jgi:site-specific DNA-methyltransferase (cytosine-N4-specific)
MKTLLKDSEKFYTPKKRPSGHDISKRFGDDNGGAIPPNLLQISNTESNSPYLRCCKLLHIDGHPARFPQKLPDFFIQFLTDPGDDVLDIFAGSNTTGASAESMGRKWLAFEVKQNYLAASAFRFLDGADEQTVKSLYEQLNAEERKMGMRLPEQGFVQTLFEGKEELHEAPPLEEAASPLIATPQHLFEQLPAPKRQAV